VIATTVRPPRRSRRRLVPGLAFSAIVVAALVALVAAPASAIVEDAITVDVQSSAQSAVVLPGGNCEWTVTSEVKVYNVTNPTVTITYTQVWPTVSWTDEDAGTSGVVTAANITTNNDGGLHAGDTLPGPQFNFATYSPYTVTFVIPCGADFGDLQVHVKTEGGANTSGDAPFLEDGSSVPAVPIAAGFTVAAVAGGFLLTRRRRRQPVSVQS
jgi:hypothetical protein